VFRRTKRVGATRAGQGGFSLVEVVVAVGLLVLVLVAVLPELVVGIRATSGAKNLAQAKGVLQGQLEEMRSMPYHVGPAAGDYIDLLDTYYRDMGPAATPDCSPGGLVGEPQVAWSGFVPASSPARCDYEPATGAFYRKVIPGSPASGFGKFTLVVDSAFLSGSVPPVVDPGEGYASQTAGKDTPGSSMLGVWATVVYRQSSALKPVSTYTQISARSPVESSLEVAATVNTVRVSSQTPSSSLITLDAGVVAQTGARFTGSSVNVNASAVSAGSGTGALAEGAKATLSAPASAFLTDWSLPGQSLNSTCPPTAETVAHVCFGRSSVAGASVSAENGLPLSATASAPLRVAASAVRPDELWQGYSSSKYGGFWFNNEPDVAGAGYARGLVRNQPMVTLDGNAPGVSKVQSGCASTAAVAADNFFSASGFLAADPVTDPSAVWACVTGRSAPVMLFPTPWARDGIIRVTLDQSSLQCKVVRSGGVRSATATAKFSATVQYWDGASSSYVTIKDPANPMAETTVTDTSTVDPLALVPLTTIVTPPGVTPALTLGSFIQSWRASTSSDVETTKPPGSVSEVRAKIPGVVSIDSQPTREGDESSVVSVTVGTFTCNTKDVR
jgi:type II secretory pathway pseudopilin PulG